jgi:hypothetical protein
MKKIVTPSPVIAIRRKAEKQGDGWGEAMIKL